MRPSELSVVRKLRRSGRAAARTVLGISITQSSAPVHLAHHAATRRPPRPLWGEGARRAGEGVRYPTTPAR